MRIGAAFEPNAAAFYRGVYPLEAGHSWAKRQTIAAVADEYEALFEEAVRRAREPALATA